MKLKLLCLSALLLLSVGKAAHAKPIAYIQLTGGVFVLEDEVRWCTGIGGHAAIYLSLTDEDVAEPACWTQVGDVIKVYAIQDGVLVEYPRADVIRLPKLTEV